MPKKSDSTPKRERTIHPKRKRQHGEYTPHANKKKSKSI